MDNPFMVYIYISYIILVGGFNPSEKYLSVGIIIPKIWKNRIHAPNHQPDTVSGKF